MRQRLSTAKKTQCITCISGASEFAPITSVTWKERRRAAIALHEDTARLVEQVHVMLVNQFLPVTRRFGTNLRGVVTDESKVSEAIFAHARRRPSMPDLPLRRMTRAPMHLVDKPISPVDQFQGSLLGVL